MSLDRSPHERARAEARRGPCSVTRHTGSTTARNTDISMIELPTVPHPPRKRVAALGLACFVSMLPSLACDQAEAPQPSSAPTGARADAPPRPEPAAEPPEPAPEPSKPEPSKPPEPPEPPKPETTAEPEPSPSFTDEQRALLMAGAEEVDLPRPDISYVMSNESRHDLWFPYIDGVGGAYVGVGSDTNYTLMGYARSEVVFLVDHDPRIVDVHRVYEILIEASADPDALLHHFERDHQGATVALIEKATTGLPAERQRDLVRTYRSTRETLRRYLSKLRVRRRNDCPSTWLSSPSLYEHVRTLYQQGRVRIMPGDLRGKTTLPTVIAALRALEMPVKVLYLSNAEQYFAYTKNVRKNLGTLPTAAGGVVLRTIFQEPWEHADGFWSYQVQDLEDFQRRLGGGWLKRKLMWSHAEREGVLEQRTETRGLSRIALAAPPPERRAGECSP